MTRGVGVGAITALLMLGLSACRAPHPSRITPEQAIASKIDLWGEAALKQPRGPTYAYFEKLLPPLRYVDADFRHYPIVMSAPGSLVKGRLVSNGSSINALARQPNWLNEQGIPAHVLVGASREAFGSDFTQLDGPRYVAGFLPIVQLRYRRDRKTYGQEVFASVDPALAEFGAIIAKLDYADRIELRLETGHEFLSDEGRTIRDTSGKVLAAYDENWEYNKFRSSLTSKPGHGSSAVAVLFTKPAEPAVLGLGKSQVPAPRPGEEEAAGNTSTSTSGPASIDLAWYQQQRQHCEARWREIVNRGAQFDVPEPVVNNAWRSLVVATHAIQTGDRLNYSAGNQYARQYANESGDTMRSMLLMGHRETAQKSIRPLFEYRRPKIEIHDGAFKLELLADYYFQTQDRELIEELRPLWQREIDLLLTARQPDGLLPREKYCSDIDTPVHSLNNNANAWRGLRDMAVVMAQCGYPGANQLANTAAQYRPLILAAMEKSIDHSVDPPFVPVALDGEEKPTIPITSTRMGSYWNLVAPCVLWSGLFPIGSRTADAMMDYIRLNGGLCMGMVRVQSARGVWVNTQNIDDLYTIRYQLALLRRDREGDVDRALVGFYGKLTQGFTRDTFIDGESTSIVPLDRFGRQVALPPNSTANACFLIPFRNLLVQDWDTDDDGRADELRLAFATPRAWLENGKRIRVERAPTQFGEISYEIRSLLGKGRIEADLTLPARRAASSVRLRLRSPGFHLHRAQCGDQTLPINGETIDLSRLTGSIHVVAHFTRAKG